MDWMNIHIPSVIRSPEYVGSSPAERGTWLSVMAYACEIECGGRLPGAATWKDRQWQQACGVTIREVKASFRLLRFDGDDCVVNGYPHAAERQVTSGRANAKAGAMARWSKSCPSPSASDALGHAKGYGTALPSDHAKGEGKGEGEGEGAPACPTAPPPNPTTSLATWVRHRTSDPEKSRENSQELAGLITRFGIKSVQKTAEKLAFERHRKVWPNEISDAILAELPTSEVKPATAEDRMRAGCLNDAERSAVAWWWSGGRDRWREAVAVHGWPATSQADADADFAGNLPALVDAWKSLGSKIGATTTQDTKRTAIVDPVPSLSRESA